MKVWAIWSLVVPPQQLELPNSSSHGVGNGFISLEMHQRSEWAGNNIDHYLAAAIKMGLETYQDLHWKIIGIRFQTLLKGKPEPEALTRDILS
ncbi:hypothetical protein L195_g002654 [Trifolium pratense]|uniref:Uncharacterized protein n=1 Tax=Trifolium pratense TaxID=57577 RepID=A0A2K3NT34_TRIPR|nr:hypothetical protein L195_g002654 [Trifolium pratense]